MEELLLDYLGPYAGACFLVPLAIVVFLRHRIRKRHILALLAACVLGFVGFFAALLWAVPWYDGSQSVAPFQVLLRVLAGVAVASGAAIGYFFILKSLGLASLESDGA
jgi:hypothetical protein